MASILVVDDTTIVLKVTADILTAQQHQVQVVSDAKGAIAVLGDSATEVDLMISDIVLPDMTGVELITKALELRPLLPVIAMTGYSKEESAEINWTLADLGIQELLRKPFRAHELLAAVSQALSAHLNRKQ